MQYLIEDADKVYDDELNKFVDCEDFTRVVGFFSPDFKSPLSKDALNLAKLLEFYKIDSNTGVVPLGNDCYAVALVDKMEQIALNFLDVDITSLGMSSEPLWNYVWGEVMDEAGAKFIDLLYDTMVDKEKYSSRLIKVNDITYYIDSRCNDCVYRTTYTIRDLKQFKIWYTKYNITRNK